MHTILRSTFAALTLLFFLGVGTACTAQRAEPIRGSIAVADDDAAERGGLARITPEQARDAALARLTDATYTGSELDEEDGFLVYDVELRTATQEYDVLVDAGTGDVLRVEEEPADRD